MSSLLSGTICENSTPRRCARFVVWKVCASGPIAISSSDSSVISRNPSVNASSSSARVGRWRPWKAQAASAATIPNSPA